MSEEFFTLQANTKAMSAALEGRTAVLADVQVLLASLERKGLEAEVNVHGALVTLHIDLGDLQQTEVSLRALPPPMPLRVESPAPASIPPLEEVPEVNEPPAPLAGDVKEPPCVAPMPEPEPPTPIVKGTWSDDEVRKAHEMLDRGCKGGEIARALNREMKPVSVKLAKIRKDRAAGLKPPPPSDDGPLFRTGTWGADEVAQLTEMVNAGRNQREIAEVLGRKPSVVGDRMLLVRRAQADAREAQKEARKPAQIADPFDGETPSPDRAVIAYLNTLGNKPPWTAQADHALLQHLLAAKPLVDLAYSMGLSQASLKARFRHLNTRLGDLEHQSRLARIVKARAEVT